MAIKFYKPTTPGRRNMTTMDYSGLSKVAPERSLLEPIKKNAGRNSYGRITVRHRGGGNRRKYRVIDFKRERFGIPDAEIGGGRGLAHATLLVRHRDHFAICHMGFPPPHKFSRLR